MIVFSWLVLMILERHIVLLLKCTSSLLIKQTTFCSLAKHFFFNLIYTWTVIFFLKQSHTWRCIYCTCYFSNGILSAHSNFKVSVNLQEKNMRKVKHTGSIQGPCYQVFQRVKKCHSCDFSLMKIFFVWQQLSIKHIVYLETNSSFDRIHLIQQIQFDSLLLSCNRNLNCDFLFFFLALCSTCTITQWLYSSFITVKSFIFMGKKFHVYLKNYIFVGTWIHKFQVSVYMEISCIHFCWH